MASVMLILSIALAFQFASPPSLGDSAHVSGGRLIVEPVGVSFQIPPAWLDSTLRRLGGVGCDPRSPSARAVNTDRESLRTMTGGSAYFADQSYSALADSVFAVADLVAHVGARGWRECDNTNGDQQVRVYVEDRSPSELAQRLSETRIALYRGYSTPIVEPTRDSAGWQIAAARWTFDCGDCIGFERFEIYSRRIGRRTFSLVFMFSPVVESPPLLAPRADKQTILRSLTLTP